MGPIQKLLHCTEMKTIVIMVMVASLVQSSPVQTSELANEDTQQLCTADQISRCTAYLTAAVTLCTNMGLVPVTPDTACLFAGCVIWAVHKTNPICEWCVCEWLRTVLPRENYQCSYCESCESDYHICEDS